MNRSLVLLFSSAVLLLVLVVLMLPGDPPSPSASPANGENGTAAATVEPLVVYCAASNQAVMEAVRKDYEAEYHIPIQVQYGPSQAILASMEVSETGDLYLPADDSYFTIARDRKLIEEVLPIGAQQGVIAVPKGNPKNIKTFDDLLRENVRLVQANPDAAAITKLTREVLGQLGLWDKLAAHNAAYKGTVNEVANDVKVGSADAGIVFDSVLHTYPDLDYVELPELEKVRADFGVAVATSSEQPRRALHFARYLTARDKGLLRYAEYGFRPVEGDVWEDRPELILYAGSMLRPAIEETVQQFEQREGVDITRVYNGCGILVAQMKGGQIPDAYFACDVEFMQQVRNLFPLSADVSQNELVILVHKGNPHGIRTLKDLAKPGLRVGVGHEKQCAMGWLTERTLREGGVKDEVMSNVTVQSPTGDYLVNQLKTQSLDAVVVYLSNAAGAGTGIEAIRIEGLPCSIATQPYGVAKDTPHRRLMQRLYERLLTAESQQIFQDFGFGWKGGGALDFVAARRGQTRPGLLRTSPTQSQQSSASQPRVDNQTPQSSRAGSGQ